MLLTIVSYPAAFPSDFGYSSNLSEELFYPLTGFAFAQTDDESDDEENEDLDDDKETKEDNNLEEQEDANKAIADAEEEINKAQEKITEAKENEKDTSASELALEEAQAKLKEAKENFELGLYGLAEELADEAEDLASDARMSLLGKGIKDVEDEEDDIEDEIEIEAEIEDGVAKVKVKIDDEKIKFEFTLTATDLDGIREEIENEILTRTDLTLEQIGILEIEFEEEEIEEEEIEEEEISKLTKHELRAKENAEDAILKLQQKIEQLEQRLQTLLEKFETGEYFGPIPEPDPVTTSYSITLDGSAISLDDDSVVTDLEGEIFLETLVTGHDTSKFRITGGEILIGDTFYDFVFGKARVSSSGTSGEKDSMIILGQVMDDEGNVNTIKILVHPSSPLTGDFGLEPVDLEIKMPQSKFAKQWGLSASGQLSLLEV